jgi:hypothetical protein
MPASSKKQFKLMKAVEHGSLKLPGLSKQEAKDYIKDNKGKLAFSKLKEYVKKKNK